MTIDTHDRVNKKDCLEEAYDQYLDELKFYSQCEGPAFESNSEDSFTDVDSGYNTARNSALPLEQLVNQPRKTTKVEKIHRLDIKLAILKLEEMHELKTEQIASNGITLETVTWHIFDFIMPKLVSDHKLPRRPCMFQVVNDRVQFHRFYTKNISYADCLSPMFLNLAQTFMETHNNWTVLMDFADNQRRLIEKPAFVTCWLEVFDDFTNDFHRRISQLKATCHDPAEAIMNAQPLCFAVNFLAHIIFPVQAAKNWKFEHVELAWSLLLTAISDDALLNDECKVIALKLQNACYSVILAAMDMIYYFGEVPEGMKADFIIYSDPNKPFKFSAHPVPSHSALWTKDSIKTVHRGAILRQRLGLLFNSDSLSFTESFTNLLPDWRTKICPLLVLRQVFHNTAVSFTDRLGEELFRNVMDAGLVQIWSDMKNITIGAAACGFATATFNLERSVSPVKAFAHALKIGNVSSVATWTRENIPGHTGQLQCEVPGILSHLISNSVIKTMNNILDSCLTLYRMYFILVAVLADKQLLISSRDSLRRQFRFFASNLHNVLTIIRNDFYHRVEQVFDETAEKLKNLTSYYDAEVVLRQAEKDLIRLVDAERDFSTRTLWTVIHTFAGLIDDVRLKSLSNSVDSATLKDWQRKLLCCYEAIRSHGSTVSPDNLFFSLYKQMQYR